MTVAKLISLLQKCSPNAQVNTFTSEGNLVIDFVEHQLTANSVLLLADEPNWKEVGEEDCVEIAVFKQEPRFAETTWKSI